MLFSNIFRNNQQEFNDLIFQNRNRDYGAYQLRKQYPNHLNQSLLISSSITVFLFLICYYLNKAVPTTTNTSDEISYSAAHEIETIEIPKPETSTPPPVRINKKDFNYALTRDSVLLDQDTTTNSMVANEKGQLFGADTATAFGTNRIPGTGSINNPKTDSSNIIHIMPGVMPEFPGGMTELMQYLAENIHCDRWNRLGSIGGKIVISMVISRDGSVNQAEILRDEIGFECAEQVVDVVKNMPKWKPGMQGTHPVNVRYILPVFFEK
jgi:protein TonB